jgi:hypothetical protein
MTTKTNTKIGYSIAVSVLTAVATIGVAHADWTNAPGEGGISASGYFSNFGTAGKSPEIDHSKYDKVNLGPLSSSISVLKAGAQGPLRDAHADQVAAQLRDIESRLGPVGGRNTQ